MTTPADVPLMERVVRESGVETRVPSPAVSDYLRAVAEAALDAISGLRAPEGSSRLPEFLVPLAVVLAAAVLGLAAIGIARLAIGAWRDRARRTVVEPPGPVFPTPDKRGHADWRAEIDRRLAKGDLAGALEALWWWFAAGVSTAEVDPSWTSGELLFRCGRRDLLPLGRTLDRMLYGSERPRADDVRRFVVKGEAALS